ncbi:MAG: dihydroorotate dehydrogenase-like protein [Anaerolineae bacterium]|nr:dihydroorotate dehydrogenase-like protein [Anaerolineae bacterium]
MDLSTTYLGMTLKSPLVASASPLSRNLDVARRMEDAGASALVMYSLFEEEASLESEQLDHYLSYFTEAFAEALSWHPEQKTYHVGPQEYLNAVARLKQSLGIPVIGSLNGVSTGGWIENARGIQEAGADALELNVYFIPTDVTLQGSEVERMAVEVLEAVKRTVSIPVAVKLSPYYSSTPNMLQRLSAAGADALVLFNRFYQPDLDLDALQVVPRLVLSTSAELRLPLRWVAIMYGRIEADMAITGGVHTHEDAAKAIMAGAKVAMMTSEILARGVGRFTEIEQGLRRWMGERGYESVTEMRGSMSQRNVGDPAAFERANYMRVLQSWRPDPAGQLFREMIH